MSRSIVPTGSAPGSASKPRWTRIAILLAVVGFVLVWVGLEDRSLRPPPPRNALPESAQQAPVAQSSAAPLSASPGEQSPVAEIRVLDAASTAPITHARVEVIETANGEPLAVSASASAFAVSGVASGATYRVEVRTPDAEHIPYRGIHPANELFPLTVELHPAALPVCEVLDSSGFPIIGASVWVGGPEARISVLPRELRSATPAGSGSSMTTDRHGRAELGPLPAGSEYWVVAEAEGYARTEVGDLDFPAGRTTVTLSLQSEAVVRYSVSPGGALRHTLVSVEEPVQHGAGSFVPADEEQPPRPIGEDVYEARGLTPGLKAIQVVRELTPGTIEVSRTSVRLREGETRDLGRLEPSTTECVIRVLGPGGEPAIGVKIRGGVESGDVTFDLAKIDAQSNASGEIVIRGLPPRRTGFHLIPPPQMECETTPVWIDFAREDSVVIDLVRRAQRIEIAWRASFIPAEEDAAVDWLAIANDGRVISSSRLPYKEAFRVRDRSGVRARVFARSEDLWVGSSGWFDFGGASGQERTISLGRGKSVRGRIPSDQLAQIGIGGVVGMYEASTTAAEGRNAVPIGTVTVGEGGEYRFDGVPVGERLVFAALSSSRDHFAILDSPEE
jgi:hypothetical protein